MTKRIDSALDKIVAAFNSYTRIEYPNPGVFGLEDLVDEDSMYVCTSYDFGRWQAVSQWSRLSNAAKHCFTDLKQCLKLIKTGKRQLRKEDDVIYQNLDDTSAGDLEWYADQLVSYLENFVAAYSATVQCYNKRF
ncbi:MAG: hypothetical protein AAF355_13140 [Myxococcota bacterium]